MMLYVVFGIIILCILGILYFSRQATPGKKSRMQFLKELENFFEAPLEPIPEYEDSFRIPFSFEGRRFVYEDILSPGFKGMINQSCMKGTTNTSFTLDFTEKERKGFLQTDAKVEKKTAGLIHLPKQLAQFSVFSNKPAVANKFLKDPAMVRVFTEFKNYDNRGRPLLTLKIVHGTVILDFHPSGRCHPKPLAQLSSFESLEDYLDKMILVMKKLEAVDKH